MKTTISKTLKITALALLVATPLVSFSQVKKEKKSTVHIKIEQDIDGKKKVYEKDMDATGLSATEREDMIEKFQDSVMAENKGKIQGMKVEVETISGDEENNNNRTFNREENHFDSEQEKPRVRVYRRNGNGDDNQHYEFHSGDDDVVIRDKPRTRVYRRDGKNDEDFLQDFNLDMESLRDNLKEMGKDLKFEYRTLPDVFAFDGSAASKTIRGLDVYPNNPKTEILNLRFSSPVKGDVTVKVMDVKGNVVAKEDIKDFTGDYVGQINIGKQKGVVFVLVTQGEDGTVKRVNLP